MGTILEMCNCPNQQQVIIPNSKSMVENDIDNNKYNYNNVVNDIKVNQSEEKKEEKLINNGKINIDQNNDAETYNNISSKGILHTPKNKRRLSKREQKKEDKWSQKSENKKDEDNSKKKKKKTTKKF